MLAANDVVNSQGITFVSRMVTETGASARRRWSGRSGSHATSRAALARWDDVEALDGVIDPELQSELLNGVDWLVETTSRWYLVQAAGQRLADAVESARDRFAELADVIDQIGPEAWREEHELETGVSARRGFPRSSRGGTRSNPSSCTRPTSSRCPRRRAAPRSRSRVGSSSSARSSRSTGSSIASRSCPSARVGTVGEAVDGGRPPRGPSGALRARARAGGRRTDRRSGRGIPRRPRRSGRARCSGSCGSSRWKASPTSRR